MNSTLMHITIYIAGFDVARIFVDTGVSGYTVHRLLEEDEFECDVGTRRDGPLQIHRWGNKALRPSDAASWPRRCSAKESYNGKIRYS